MNNPSESSAATNRASKWRLWIDRCGGYELIQASRWIVGGTRPGSGSRAAVADVQVQADWRRIEGEIERHAGQYVWNPLQRNDASPNASTERSLMVTGRELPIPGSANLVFRQPSSLSLSATLQLNPPHRFGNHIDAVILVDQTVLIGAGKGNHIRSVSHDEDVVLVLRDGAWLAKRKPAKVDGQRPKPGRSSETNLVELVPNRRISVGEMDMTLEKL